MRILFAFSLFLSTFISYAYQAVIDAGSSGTRLYIYQNHTPIYTHKIEPGLSKIKPHDIPAYLDKLMHDIPIQNLHAYFYGTAGMRLLSDAEQLSRYEAVKTWFEQHTSWIIDDIRTITGQEEGVFAWAAVNYLEPQKNSGFIPVLEIGGASIQVNLRLPEAFAKYVSSKDVYPLTIHHERILVWSKSYLGLGLNEVEKHLTDTIPCYSQGYPLKNGSLGAGDTSACIHNIESQSSIDLLERLKDVKKLLAAKTTIPWVVLGAIRYNAENPPLRLDPEFNMQDYIDKTDASHCHQPWESIFSTYLNDPYIYRLCLASSYYYATIVDGMGISNRAPMQYPSSTQNPDWTIGALMLQEL